MAARIKKGDRVVVIAGKDKGKQGDVLKVLPADNRAIVQDVMMVSRHRKGDMRNPEGGVERREAPIHLSNLAHLDPTDNKPTRIGFKTLGDGRKVRFAKRSGEQIDR